MAKESGSEPNYDSLFQTDIASYGLVIRRHAWMVAAAIALCMVVAGIATQFMEKKYEATVILYVDDPRQGATEATTASDAFQSVLFAERLARVYAILPMSEQILRPLHRSLRSGIDFENFSDSVESISVKDTSMIEVTVTAPTRALALKVARGVTDLTLRRVEQLSLNSLSRMPADERVSLRVADPASAPEEPESPILLLNLAVAGMAGLMIGAYFAFRAERKRAAS